MAPELRKTGISVVGDVPWGTHFCTFYETTQDLLDILVPFFKVGLESKEFCLWIISNSELLTMPEATSALRKAIPDLDRHLSEGRIELVRHDEWFLEHGLFNIQRVAQRFEEKVDAAVAKGYAGMRVNGSPAWLYQKDDKEIVAFEEEVDKLYPNLRVIASCTYPITESGAEELLDVAHAHQFVLTRRRGKWEAFETPELLQARSELKKANEELEQRVTERTRELAAANEELRREIADRKRAEEHLRQAEEQARKVLDTIPALIGSGPPDGTLDYCNQQWLSFSGLTLEQLGAYEGLLHPDDRERVFKAWQETVAIGKPYELEQRHRRFDGVYRWFLTRGVPLRDTEGRIERWYGTLTDIDDRKQAEKALQETEAKLKEAQRLAKIGYWERDLVADRITFSEETCRIFGLPPGQTFSHAQLRDMIHPDDRQRNERALQEALQGGRRYEIEFRITLPNRELRYIHVRDEIAYDKSGVPVRMFGSVQDITERRRAEEALRESQHLMHLVLATLPVGVAVTDRAGDIVLVNEASKRLWGDTIVSGRERWAKTKGFWHDSGEKIAPSEWASVRALSQGQTSLNELIDIETYDGRRKTMENSVAPIRNGDGQIVGAVIVNQDVTDRVSAAEQLKRTNEELRALSARLHSVREEESGRIAREIHDELGGALTSLRWDLEEIRDVISQPAESPPQAAPKEKIGSMLTLTDTIIDTVRRLASELRPTALDELGLVDAIELQALQFENRTGIAVHYESSVKSIDLNSEQSIAVFRILQEALTNILRHAQATMVTITMKQEADEFSLKIKDNGKGIPDKQTVDAHSLGLLGMRERAYLIGGAINIESAEGQGTTITLGVPISTS